MKVPNDEQISDRYGEITLALNKEFRDSDSSTANNLRVGSYGRWTAIKGISDLDMLYIMPAGKWGDYKNAGQSKLLQDTKNAIKARYPRTDIFVDSPV
ncbi:nucleotidyltransferase, partial [Pseudomonas viridiflava]|uniref:nucleotidyltransferase n=1 Tax=Pseudomonas viridiflava TaxID=33069 RepID=UPI0013CE7A30